MANASRRQLAFVLFIGWALTAASSASAQGSLRLADGDSAGLSTAIAGASDRPVTRIALAPGGHYRLAESLTMTRTDGGAGLIDIAGNGATLTLDNASLRVGDGVTLRIEDAELRPQLQRSPLHPGNIASLVVDSGGTLELERSAVVGGQLSGGRVAYLAIVAPGGRMMAVNSTIADNRIHFRGDLLAIAGAVELIQSTLAGNRLQLADGAERPAAVTSVDGAGAASIVALGSIVEACAVPVRDDGGNLSSDARCSVSSTVHDLALAPLDKAGALVPTRAPQPWSPARGIVDPATCLATDARGLSRLGGACDAGAHQNGAGPGRQDIGGINGTWFQPDNDGHYVVVNRNSPSGLVVIWMTFDRNGNQAWVYSVAEFDGRTAAGPAFVNRDGVLDEEGVPRGQQAEAWGTMRIEFDSCDRARLQFASDTEAFGSGAVSLSRLSQVDALGCAPLGDAAP